MKKNRILKPLALGICIFIIATTCSPMFSAQKNDTISQTYSKISSEENLITLTYTFEQPIVTQKKIGDITYTKVEMPDTLSMGKPGEPMLPEKSTKILIPFGEQVYSIDVIPGEKTSLDLSSRVEPATSPIPVSESPKESSPQPNENIYSSASMFPEKFFINTGTQYLKGFQILCLSLKPVQYSPANNLLQYYTDFTVVVKTRKDDSVQTLFRNLKEDTQDVQRLVDNPDMVQTYREAPTPNSITRQYDLLILTRGDLRTGFLPLASAHNREGIRTRIVSLQEISSARISSHLVVTPEEIRDFIRNEYTTHGIRYVLLGGDDDVLPVKQFYFGIRDTWMGPEYVYGPSDIYYACLDGSFNGNGNDIFGELDDNVDLFAEVYIGRACVGNLDEVNHFVEKTLTYMNYDPGETFLKEVVMAGEYLWGTEEGYPEDIYGDEYMEEIIGGSDHNTYTTVGIPNDTYSLFLFHRLYERGSNHWTMQDLINRMNSGVHFINHLGHGNVFDALQMNINNVDALTNQKLFFVYTQACLAGAFDTDWDYGIDCIAEHFTIKTDHAAFAVIMNTRYGLGDGLGTNGPSQWFHRWFWDAVFGEGITTISEANQYSKEIDISSVQYDQNMRWCYYEITLFGDPALKFNLPKPEHDISIASVDLPSPVKQCEPRLVDVLLVNNGLNDEQDVQIFLRIDGVEVSRDIIPVFAQDTEKRISLPWVTPDIGEYDITVNVTIPGIIEHDYRNNEQNQKIKVGVLNTDTDELFTSIQDALDDADTLDGHTIMIPWGTYFEQLVITKGVILQGEDQSSTVITGGNTQSDVILIMNTNASSLIKLSVRGGRNGVSIVSSSNILLRELIISENADAGVSISSSDHIWMNTNIVIHNQQGIIIDADSSHSLICLNNFDNTENAFDAGSYNRWNNTDPDGGGNYWSDFESNPGFPSGVYQIPGGTSLDHRPLSELYHPDLSKPVLNLHTGERFTRIGDALSDGETMDGHMIFVGPGLYNEKLIISKSIRLIGEDKDTTIIDGNNGDESDFTIKILANNVLVKGFTIKYTYPHGQFISLALIRIQGQQCKITENWLKGKRNGEKTYFGIVLSQSSDSTITKNTILQTEKGVIITGSRNILTGNDVEQNRYGIVLMSGSTSNRFYHNNFNNSQNVACFQQFINYWNHTDPSIGGNYWAGHTCTGNPSDGSQPYIINANNIDYYPFHDPNGWDV
ncbi:MAG: C25 family cysteine peptidase [Methanobacteriota archaeon]